MKKQLKFLVLILAATTITFSSCKKDDDDEEATPTPTTQTPGTNEVFMQGNKFTPSSITVTHGTTITWKNKDAVTHNVTSNDGFFSSGNLGSGAAYSHKFDSIGTFGYQCTLHSGMTGTVVVN